MEVFGLLFIIVVLGFVFSFLGAVVVKNSKELKKEKHLFNNGKCFVCKEGKLQNIGKCDNLGNQYRCKECGHVYHFNHINKKLDD